jgi:integrase
LLPGQEISGRLLPKIEDIPMKFTKTVIERLQPPAGKTDHFFWDDAVPGFGLRIRGGRRTWVAQLRVNGATRRLSLGDVRRIELEAARGAARKFFAQATLGADPAAERAAARARAANTVGSQVEKYLAVRESGMRPSSFRQARRYLQQYFAPLHGLPMAAVPRECVATVIAEIASTHGKVTGARARANLSAFFNWALKEGVAGEANPVSFTNNPVPDERPRDRMLSPAEIRAIWRSLPDNTFGKVARLLFLTGARRQEIGRLKWTEVDLDRGLLTIGAERMKGGKEHRLPLVAEAVEILRSVPRRSDNKFVFGAATNGFTAFSAPMAELRAALAAIGEVLEPWSLHDIRRSVRTGLGDLDVLPWIGEQILAHVRSGIEGVYNRAELERQMRQALQMWARRLHEIINDVGPVSNVVAFG